jgi:hypothetical protein
MSDLFERIGDAGIVLALGLLLLIAAGYAVDLLTPGHLMAHIGKEKSGSAAVVFSAAVVGQAFIIFTAIWTNADAGFDDALRDTIAFGIFGVLAAALAFYVISLVVQFFTKEKLGDVVCVPGNPVPLSYAAAAFQLAVAVLTIASIA